MPDKTTTTTGTGSGTTSSTTAAGTSGATSSTTTTTGSSTRSGLDLTGLENAVKDNDPDLIKCLIKGERSRGRNTRSTTWLGSEIWHHYSLKPHTNPATEPNAQETVLVLKFEMLVNTTIYDKNDAISQEWLALVATFDLPDAPRSRLEAIASKHLGGKSCKITERLGGGFNQCFRVQVDDDSAEYILRFPIPGYIMEPLAKWKSEVAVLRYLQQNTSLPIPKLIAAGIAEGEFEGLGPYVLIEFVEGYVLGEVLQKEGGRLKDSVRPGLMRDMYKRIAVLYVEMFQHSFAKIGSLSAEQNDEDGSWTFDVDSAPVTFKLSETERCSGVKVQGSTESFRTTADYFRELASQSRTSLQASGVSKNTKEEYVEDYKTICQLQGCAEHFAKAQAMQSRTDDAEERFVLFCDDMRFSNMMMNKYFEIVALFDWEFTYAAPAGFLCDPPSWLVGSVDPMNWTAEDVERYDATVQTFIEVLEEAEAESETNRYGHELSRRMKESWVNGSFWYNIALREPFRISEVLKHRKNLEPFASVKMPHDAELNALAEEEVAARAKQRANAAGSQN